MCRLWPLFQPYRRQDLRVSECVTNDEPRVLVRVHGEALLDVNAEYWVQRRGLEFGRGMNGSISETVDFSNDIPEIFHPFLAKAKSAFKLFRNYGRTLPFRPSSSCGSVKCLWKHRLRSCVQSVKEDAGRHCRLHGRMELLAHEAIPRFTLALLFEASVVRHACRRQVRYCNLKPIGGKVESEVELLYF